MTDNAMHMLLIVVSSLVLINSIIWLSLDNIGKADKIKAEEDYISKYRSELDNEINKME